MYLNITRTGKTNKEKQLQDMNEKSSYQKAHDLPNSRVQKYLAAELRLPDFQFNFSPASYLFCQYGYATNYSNA